MEMELDLVRDQINFKFFMKSPNLKVLEIQRTNLNIRIEVHKKQEVRMKIKGSF
jgi:hypothetical protein